MKKIKIAASILSADFGKLNEEIASVEPYADIIHVDVMDGHFVPNITLGAPIVKYMKTHLPLDCHLMIENPEEYIDDFANAGAKSITVHAEACSNLRKTLFQIRKHKLKAGVALNPESGLPLIRDYLDEVDLVLIMSVHPGFGGQKFMQEVLPKVQELNKIRPDLEIAIDGGINAETATLAVKAGANILVAGSYIFTSTDRSAKINSLRK